MLAQYFPGKSKESLHIPDKMCYSHAIVPRVVPHIHITIHASVDREHGVLYVCIVLENT